MNKIDAIKNSHDLNVLLAEMAPLINIGFFNLFVGADRKNSNKNVVYILPSKLGLPDRDYYISEVADPKEKREKYVFHIAKMLMYLGQISEEAKKMQSKFWLLKPF